MVERTSDFRTNYQLDTPEIAEHWEDIVEDLHAQKCPVAHSAVGEGYYVLLRDADVRKAGRDWETFSSRDGFMPNRPEGMPFWYPVECDPPFHDKLRSALNPHLSPRAINSLEPQIRQIANDLIDAFIADGHTDIVASFSTRLPGLVFAGLIAGLPLADLPWLQKELNQGLLGPHEGRAAAFGAVQVYMDGYLKKRSEAPPRGDIVDAILAVDMEGYDWADRCGTLSQLTLGGVGTTGHVIASTVHLLAERPDLREKLKAQATIESTAIEELVRVFQSSPHDGRRVQKRTEIAGVNFEPGDYVVLGYGAASKDPLVFENPHEVDLERFPNPHVGFGTGVHRCIGSHLARLQIRCAIEEFLKRIPDFHVKPGFHPSYETGITRSMIDLELRWGNADEA